MNIAFVNSTKIWSGVKTWMLEFGNELRALGDSVSFVVSDPRMVTELERLGHDTVPVRFGADYSPASVWRCYRILRSRRVDVACMNIQKELRTAGIAARLAGIPVIHRVGLPGDLNDKWDQRLTRRWIADRLLVTSENMRRDIIDLHPFVQPEDIVAIHNAKHVTAEPRHEPHHPRRFAITSRLEPAKHHAHLIQVLGELAGEGLGDFELDIYGDGQERAALERLAASSGLGSRIRFRGFARDLKQTLPSYDFGVLTSRYESLANTVLEYMAAGLPAVATRAGGIPEMVEHGRNGFLFDCGDLPALRELLRGCLTMTAGEYGGLSRAALGTIRERFDPATQARRLHEFAAGLVRGA